ncbi:uncharacterized protein LOC112171466 [Rosa chinensis]|uniref:uncharacterized protein LOC112171466 n=1 Tax=Rosa chinensis TaxID=74649 RepID=UPI000D087727|nr:uncharacterized protein LOC112171466 [Rosa chinensis]
MATPPSPTASPSASPVSATATATKKPHPIPWTHEETVHLIQSYQDKWYELRRGQLKASQWEEVAVTVAARCGYEYTEPSKTATQCRHKMEKLRQRHRSVKKRLGLSFGSGWPYFDLMERLEQGPMPISARRPFSSGAKEGHFRDSTAAKRPRESAADDDGYYGDVVDGQRGTEMVVELATEIRGFAKRLIGVENMRMEIMRETERCRLEMENKRIDMILQSQRKIVDSIDRAFGLD